MIYYNTLSNMVEDLNKLDSYKPFGSRDMANRPAKKISKSESSTLINLNVAANAAAYANFDPAFMIGSQITEETDWDYSAPHNEKNHNVMIASGFTYWPPENLGYKDVLTTGVYIKDYHPKFDKNNFVMYAFPVKVNVVLRNDYELFCTTWDTIDPEFYYKYLWKRSPNYDGLELAEIKETIKDIMNQLFKTAASR